MKESKGRTIAYWVTTVLLALGFGFGGVLDFFQVKDAMVIITHLGYPAYFASIIGAWKVLAAIAILAPGFPRLKEWAYAGIVFDLTGAAISHVMVGDGAQEIMTPIVFLGVAIASWALRPDSRKLPSPR